MPYPSLLKRREATINPMPKGIYRKLKYFPKENKSESERNIVTGVRIQVRLSHSAHSTFCNYLCLYVRVACLGFMTYQSL